MKRKNGKNHVEVDLTSTRDRGLWSFCQNGYHSVGVYVNVDQFDMLKDLVHDAKVVEYYEELRRESQAEA